MSRAIFVTVFAWLFAGCAQLAYGQHNQLINESVRLYGQGRFVEALETAERALKSAEEKLGPEHLDVATALNNLAEFGQVAAINAKDEAAYRKAIAIAEPLHKRALAIREKALGLRHSFTLTSMVNLARTYGQQRRYDDAEALYKRTLEILNEIGPRAAVLADLTRQATMGLSGIESARRKNEASAQTQTATEKQYANPDHRWSVSYPADWKLDDNDRFFVKISRGPALLGIHTFADVTGKSLDEVADAALERWEQNMRKVNVVTQISRQRVTLPGNLPAIEIVHHVGRGVLGKSRKVIAVVKDRAFWIDAEMQLASWAEYERDFNRIIESFRVQE
jgi:tetratricopeptide (TPR) repeat protein